MTVMTTSGAATDEGLTRSTRFARVVFTIAGIWGVLIMTPLYFTFDAIGRAYPPRRFSRRRPSVPKVLEDRRRGYHLPL